MHESLLATFPESPPQGIYAPEGTGFAALSYVTLPNGQIRKVYLNPYTGAIQGHTSFFNVQRFFRTFHRRLFDGRRGIVIVTLTGFVLLIAGLSGFFYYKGWLKQMFTLRLNRSWRLVWSDLHKTTGIWALVFSLLIAFTGIFYFVEVCYQSVDNYKALLPPPLPQVDTTTLASYGTHPSLLPANTYVSLAQKAFPKLEIRSLGFPSRQGAPVQLDGQAGNPFTRDRANKVLLHPFNGEVIAIQKSSELSIVPFITDMVDPVHFGYFGGLITKILWFVFGLFLSFSILAGTYIWIIRTAPQKRTKTTVSNNAQTFPWLRGATLSLAFTLAYFIVSIFGTIDGILGYGKTNPLPMTIAELSVGPYQVRVDCAVPDAPQQEAQLTAQFLGDTFPNYKKISIQTHHTNIPLKGTVFAPKGSVPFTPNTPLHIDIEMWDGTHHQASLLIPQSLPTRTHPISALPDTAPGTWWVIAFFSTLTLTAITGWFYFILRAFRRTTNPVYQTNAAYPENIKQVV